MEFEVHGDYIKLEALLKATAFVQSGGEAKMIIQNGEILVNGETETRRGKKIIKGDVVTGKYDKSIDITVI